MRGGPARTAVIERRTGNMVRNPRALGAVAGTPGTMPTNWSTYLPLSGMSFSVVGSGFESSQGYVDVRMFGTPTGAGSHYVFYDVAGQFPCVPGQIWQQSVFLRLVGGTLANVQCSIGIEWDTAAFAYVSSFAQNVTPTAAALVSQGTTIATPRLDATSAQIKADFVVTFAAAVATDLTVRIGNPQVFHR